MITNDINLFGLARVEDEFVIIPSWHWTRTRTYFSLPLYFKVFIWKHAIKFTLITLKDDVSGLAVSRNNTRTIVSPFDCCVIKCQEISSFTLFTLSLTRPSPKLPSPVWPWPGEPSDLHWLGNIVHCWRTIPFMNKKARSARVCVYTLPSPRQSLRCWPVWRG